MKTHHVTWSIEEGGRCPQCGGATVLVVAPEEWGIDEEDREGEDCVDIATVYDEVSGHYCKTCERLVSLSLNTDVY